MLMKGTNIISHSNISKPPESDIKWYMFHLLFYIMQYEKPSRRPVLSIIFYSQDATTVRSKIAFIRIIQIYCRSIVQKISLVLI